MTDDPPPVRTKTPNKASPRYRPGPGGPKIGKLHPDHINTRTLSVAIREDLYIKLSQVSLITKIPRWRLVESALKMKFLELKRTWNLDEWLMKMPDPHEIPTAEDLDKE